MNRRLLISLTAILILSCSTMYGPKGNPCQKHVPLSSSNRPIICVDDRNLARLTTNPYETWAKKNSPIRWYTVSGNGGLSVSFANEACIKSGEVKCDGGPSCNATMRADAAAGTRCEYSITLTREQGQVTEDPIIVVDSGMYDDKALEPPSQ
jgi:hypothetical protein